MIALLSRRLRLDRLGPALLEPRVASAALVAAALAASVQRYLLTALGPAEPYSHYNNFRIFTASFRHLAAGRDLYALYPAEHWDLFKYSPTFAALMAPFAALPEWAALAAWNVLNAAVLGYALTRLTAFPARARALAAWLVFLDALTAFHNAQTNALLAGTMVLGYVALEEDRPGRAALLLVGGAFVKVYPGAALLVALLHPRRLRFAAWAALWTALLAAVPLLLVGPGVLAEEYRSWARLLASDGATLTGLSVQRVLAAWLHLHPPKLALALAGAGAALAPAVRARFRGDPRFRLSFLGALLVAMVVFNPEAESATFVIATTGVVLAYLAGPRRSLDRVLLGLVLALTSMAPHYPRSWVMGFFEPYAVKAIPCIAYWAVTVWRLAAVRSARVEVGPVEAEPGAEAEGVVLAAPDVG